MCINNIVIENYCTVCELLGTQRCWNLGSRMWKEKHRFESGTNWQVRNWPAGGTALMAANRTLRDDRGGMML
jgi:hypothetical protein